MLQKRHLRNSHCIQVLSDTLATLNLCAPNCPLYLGLGISYLKARMAAYHKELSHSTEMPASNCNGHMKTLP